MTTARERILGAVRDGLSRAKLPDAFPDRPDLSWVGSGAPSPGSPQLMAPFAEAVRSLTGELHEADSASEVARLVAEIAGTHQATRYLSWDGDELGCEGLIERLAAAGLSRVPYNLSPEPAARGRDVLALDDVPLGLTGAVAGLADTGGIVLTSGAGRGRLTSLLPPVHVAILSRRLIYPSLPVFLRALPRSIADCSNLVVVAGPSRTADIEMTLSHGVHGPKAIHVILTA